MMTLPGPTPSASPVKESIRAIRVSLLDQRHSSVVIPAGTHSGELKLASRRTLSPTLTTARWGPTSTATPKQLSTTMMVPPSQPTSRRAATEQ
jgi:hypothetical protein